MLDMLREEAGLTLHRRVDGAAGAAYGSGGGAGDGGGGAGSGGSVGGGGRGGGGGGSGSLQALPEEPGWLAEAPSGPTRAGGAFEAEAKLTVRPVGLLFRGLRNEEVEWTADGGAHLISGVLKPKGRGLAMGVAEAVAKGSTVHESPFIHWTTDITKAAFFALPKAEGDGGTRTGSGFVAVLDRLKLEATGANLIDLTIEAERRSHGIEAGSEPERLAVAASEVLLRTDEFDANEALIGKLLDVRRLGVRTTGKMENMMSTIDDKNKVWLAGELYKYHDESETIRRKAAAPSTRLTLVTDASVQQPRRGIMAAYMKEEEAAEEAVVEMAAKLCGDELRWCWSGGGGGGGSGAAGSTSALSREWRLQATDGAGRWHEVRHNNGPLRPAGGGHATRHGRSTTLGARINRGDGVYEPAEVVEEAEAGTSLPRAPRPLAEKLHRLRARQRGWPSDAACSSRRSSPTC